MAEESLQNNFFDTEYLKADLKGRSVRGGAVTMAAQGARFFLQICSTVVLARLLTPEDFGLIAMVAVVTGFVMMFKDMGLSMATVQKAEINHGQISTLFWINVALSLSIMLVTAVLAPAIAWFYGEPRLTWITLALASAFIFGGFTIQHQALLRRQMRFSALAVVEIISMSVGVAAAIITALYGAGYWSLVVMQLATAISIAVGVWIASEWRPGLPRWGSGVWSMLAFGGNLTGFSVINYSAAQIDRVLIGRYIGSGPVGLYHKAYNLLLLPLRQINAPVTAVAIPALSRIVDDPVRYRKAYFKMSNYIVMLAVPGVAFLIGTSDWIVRLVLGPQWDKSARIFAILGFAGLIMPILNPLGWLFITQGRTCDMLHLGAIDAFIKILSVVIGLQWGVTGVAVAVAIRYYIEAPLLIWFCCRKGPIRPMDFLPTFFFGGVLSISVLSAVLAFRKYCLISSPFLGSLSSFGVAAVITLIMLCILPNGRSMLEEMVTYCLALMGRKMKGQI